MSVIFTCGAKALHILDTDGDKIAMVDDENIISAVKTGLPMLFDPGKKGKEVPNNRQNIFEYDKTTVLAPIMSIGEITNMATTWKDIVQNPNKMAEMNLTPKLIDNNVCILRFSQGTSIDFAKTGYFFSPPKYALTMKSPHWKPWSERMMEFGFKGAEKYESSSQMGQLYNAVTKYLDEKFKDELKESTRDFTFEFTDNVNYEELLRVKPIIAEMESNYRNELRVLHDMKLDDDDQKEYISAIMDKYQYAVASIDADIRSIAAAAYIHTYYESSSKSNKISFPWIVCFEGLLLNIAENSTSKLKLRKVRFDGHIDDIPTSIKVYRNQSIGDDYIIDVKAPNGTYQTHKRHGQVYIVMASKSQGKKVERKLSRPVERAINVQFNSFNHNDSNATEIVELLKANNGLVKIQRVKDRGQKVNSLHAGVWIGEKRVANVNRQQKHTLIPFLQEGAAIFKVQDFEKISPVYCPERGKNAGKLMEHKYLTLNLFLQELVEGVTLTPSEENPHEYIPYEDTGVPYYGEDTGVPYVESYEPPVVEFDDEEVSPYYVFDNTEVFNKLSKRATYWNVDVEASEFGVVGASVEQTEGQYIVEMYREDGGKARFEVQKNCDTKQFEIVGKAPKNVRLHALALQVAHYELYKAHVEAKKHA